MSDTQSTNPTPAAPRQVTLVTLGGAVEVGTGAPPLKAASHAGSKYGDAIQKARALQNSGDWIRVPNAPGQKSTKLIGALRTAFDRVLGENHGFKFRTADNGDALIIKS